MSDQNSTSTEATQASGNDGVTLTQEQLDRMIDERMKQRAGDGGGSARDIVPNSQRSGDMQTRGRGSADVGTEELQKPEVRDANLYLMLNEVVRGRPDRAQQHAEKLVRGGHYGERAARAAHQRGQGDYYSTIVDEDGAFLLPVEVRQEIEELADVVGVARQVANTFSQVTGQFRAPGGSGAEQSMQAVGEGGEITSTKRAFRAVLLNPKKWATIVPWTYEASVEMGARIMQDVNRAIARSAARAEDEAMIKGDGTSTYNSIDGIFSATRIGNADGNNVGQQTLASGSTSSVDIDPDDLINIMNELDPGARRGDLTYIFHPDMEATLRTKKDDNGAYIFDYQTVEGVDMLQGKRILYTEALPSNTDVGSDEDFGLLVNGAYWQMATGQGLSTEEARSGTVLDADTGETINLFTQDLRALKVRTFFDMGANFNAAFAKFTTAAS